MLSLLPSEPAWLRGQLCIGKDVSKESRYPKSRASALDSLVSSAISPSNPADPHMISVHFLFSLITSCPVCLLSFFSSNRWFLSCFSYIIKSSWVLGWTLNISPSHISVFLNVFPAPTQLRGMQAPLNPVAYWDFDSRGCAVGRSMGGATDVSAGKKGLQRCLLIHRLGQSIPSKFFLPHFETLFLDFLYNVCSKVFYHNFVQTTSICK